MSLKERFLSVEPIYDEKDVFVWLLTGFGMDFYLEALPPFVMDHKLGLIGAEKSCSSSIISPLVALMMDRTVIPEAQ